MQHWVQLNRSGATICITSGIYNGDVLIEWIDHSFSPTLICDAPPVVHGTVVAEHSRFYKKTVGYVEHNEALACWLMYASAQPSLVSAFQRGNVFIMDAELEEWSRITATEHASTNAAHFVLGLQLNMAQELIELALKFRGETRLFKAYRKYNR